MNITKTGLVSDTMIKEAISKNYNIPIPDVTTTYNNREKFVKYSFTKNEGGKFSTTSINTLDKDEIFQILKGILHSENISFHTLQPKFEYSTENIVEPFDYIGYEFTYGNGSE